jgi:hypothetical protein
MTAKEWPLGWKCSCVREVHDMFKIYTCSEAFVLQLIGSCRLHCVVESCRVVPSVIVEHIDDARWFARAILLSCASSQLDFIHQEVLDAVTCWLLSIYKCLAQDADPQLLISRRSPHDSASLLRLPRHGQNFTAVPSCWRETV